MKKFALILAAALLMSFGAQASTTIEQMTTGPGTLTGNEQLPFLYSGNTTSFKTTAQKIANLASSISTPSFNVAAYGAVCDGAIVASGISVTAGSPTLAVTQTASLDYPNFQFTAALIGATVVVNNAQLNTGTSPTNIFISTIIAVPDGNHATLAANVPFSNPGGGGAYKFNALHLYKTVNTTALQAALDAGNATGYGGNILFPAGVCATAGPLTFYGAQKISGQGPIGSIVMLANGSNSDLFKGYQFDSMTGTAAGAYGGTSGFVFEDIGLDGNKGANTGSNIGLPNSTGTGLKFFGGVYYTNRVFINNFAADGWYSEWNNGAGDPLNVINSENAYPEHMQFANNAGWSIVYNGPHDGYFSDFTTINCGTGGMLIHGFGGGPAGANGVPIHITRFHSYQCTTDLDMQNGVRMDDSDLEGNTIVRWSGLHARGTTFSTLTLGAPATAAVYDINCTNCGVGTLVNNVGSGFRDEWVGGSITSVTGLIPYLPWFSFGVQNANNSPWFGGVGLSGEADETIGVNRPCCGLNTFGKNLTISAGGATPLFTDLAGGNLILRSGIPTGTGSSQISFQVYTAGVAGFNDNPAVTAMTIDSTGRVGIGTTTPSNKLTVSGSIAMSATTTNQPTNGFWLDAANSLSVSTSGVQAMQVTPAVVAFTGAAATVTAGAGDCGTSPAIAGDDTTGRVTVGSSTNGGKCTVVFAKVKTTAPVCVCNNETNFGEGCWVVGTTTTGMALTATTSTYTAADKLGYHCFGYQQ